MLLSFSIFSQNKNDENISYLGHTFKLYDSEANTTTIRDFFSENKIFIKGKWSDFDFSKSTCHQLIPDCPILINKENLILECWIRKDKEYNWKKKSNTGILQKAINQETKKWNDYDSKFSVLENNTSENYIIYTLEKPLRESHKLIRTVKATYLLGVKNNKVYRLAVQNYVENEISNLEEFLTGIYFLN